jgi:hypothetical protein
MSVDLVPALYKNKVVRIIFRPIKGNGQEDGKKLIMRVFIISTLHQVGPFLQYWSNDG